LEWSVTGILLRRAQDRFEQMDFMRHFRDVLIALQATRAGARLVTENPGHFWRWKFVMAPGRKTLLVFHPVCGTL
jgi:hypothetical protein